MFRTKFFPIALAAIVTFGVPVAPAVAAELSRTAFTRYAHGGCPSSDVCTLTFFTVSSKHVYEISFVSCRALISNVNAHVQDWNLLLIKGDTQIFGMVNLLPWRMGQNNFGVTYAATSPVTVQARADQQILVNISRDSSTTTGNISMLDCTIGGDHVVLK